MVTRIRRHGKERRHLEALVGRRRPRPGPQTACVIPEHKFNKERLTELLSENRGVDRRLGVRQDQGTVAQVLFGAAHGIDKAGPSTAKSNNAVALAECPDRCCAKRRVESGTSPPPVRIPTTPFLLLTAIGTTCLTSKRSSTKHDSSNWMLRHVAHAFGNREPRPSESLSYGVGILSERSGDGRRGLAIGWRQKQQLGL